MLPHFNPKNFPAYGMLHIMFLGPIKDFWNDVLPPRSTNARAKRARAGYSAARQALQLKPAVIKLLSARSANFVGTSAHSRQVPDPTKPRGLWTIDDT